MLISLGIFISNTHRDLSIHRPSRSSYSKPAAAQSKEMQARSRECPYKVVDRVAVKAEIQPRLCIEGDAISRGPHGHVTVNEISVGRSGANRGATPLKVEARRFQETRIRAKATRDGIKKDTPRRRTAAYNFQGTMGAEENGRRSPAGRPFLAQFYRRLPLPCRSNLQATVRCRPRMTASNSRFALDIGCVWSYCCSTIVRRNRIVGFNSVIL